MVKVSRLYMMEASIYYRRLFSALLISSHKKNNYRDTVFPAIQRTSQRISSEEPPFPNHPEYFPRALTVLNFLPFVYESILGESYATDNIYTAPVFPDPPILSPPVYHTMLWPELARTHQDQQPHTIPKLFPCPL